MEYKKLYRSRNNRVLSGFAGGLGEYFGIDPMFFRLAFIAPVLWGVVIPIYIIAWLFVPLARQ